MNWDLISVLIFYLLLLVVYYKFKNKFENQGLLVLYKTKLGLNLMDKISKKFPRIVTFLSYTGIIVGFSGMAFILYFLIKETIKLILVPGTPSALAPVLPGISIPGVPTLSFWHWIITIFIAAGIHEFAHGVVARNINVPIKSSGFAFLGPLLAAFVEPDEKIMEKKPILKQLAVFAAGPFSNILLGIFVLLAMMFIFAPFLGMIYDSNGISVSGFIEDSAMNQSGIELPFTIISLNDNQVLTIKDFVNETSYLNPGDEIVVGTDKGDYNIVLGNNPENESLPYFGIIGLQENLILKDNLSFLNPIEGVFEWFQLLFMWLFLISVGVGLFNLLPLGPVDGGRMIYSLGLVFFSEKVAKRILLFASLVCLALIIINMIPWIEKLIIFIWGILILVFTLL
ncbi:site-2 protease family protein [Candidatus Woesearchaeota archaeon]|nr:site-2 protease family protein [Candidatus Woesearchaeota archaeon]